MSREVPSLSHFLFLSFTPLIATHGGQDQTRKLHGPPKRKLGRSFEQLMAHLNQLRTQNEFTELPQRRDRDLPTLGDALHERPRARTHFRHRHDVACIWDNLSRMRLFTASDDVC